MKCVKKINVKMDIIIIVDMNNVNMKDGIYHVKKELQDEDVMVLVGAGQKGKEPLIFQANGMPYRGFLEGRVDGKKYQLLLHLSNMELKRINLEPKK